MPAGYFSDFTFWTEFRGFRFLESQYFVDFAFLGTGFRGFHRFRGFRFLGRPPIGLAKISAVYIEYTQLKVSAVQNVSTL